MRSAQVSVDVPQGNAVEISVVWHDMEGAEEAPSSVEYQVFNRDGEGVSDLTTVSEPDADMSFVVPGTDLPAGAQGVTPLTIQIRATFPAGDTHTAVVRVDVRKLYEFSE